MKRKLVFLLSFIIIFTNMNFSSSMAAGPGIARADVETLCNLEFKAVYEIGKDEYKCYVVNDNRTENFKFILNKDDKVVFFKDDFLVVDEKINEKLMTMRIADNLDVWYKLTLDTYGKLVNIKKSAQLNKAIGVVGNLGGSSIGVITTTVITGGASEFSKLATAAGTKVLKSYVLDVENILTEVKWHMLGNNIDKIASIANSIQSKRSDGIRDYEEAKAIIDEATNLEREVHSTTKILMGALNNVPADVKDYFANYVFQGFIDGAMGSTVNALKHSDDIYKMMVDSDRFYNLCKFTSDVYALKENTDKLNDFLLVGDSFGEFSDYLNARNLKNTINVYNAGVVGNRALVAVLENNLDGMTELKIPARYDWVAYFYEGMAKVSRYGKVGFINTDGQEVVSPSYDDCGNFSNGLACVYKGDKFGFIDKSGKLAIPLQYSNETEYYQKEIFEFVNGKCIVSKRTAPYKNLYGVIDLKGNEIVPCKYNYIFLSNAGEIYYLHDDYNTYISYSNPNKKLSYAQCRELNNTLPGWRSDNNNNWSLYDKNNQCIIKDKYNFDINTYSEFSVDELYFKYSNGVAIAASGAYLQRGLKNEYWIVDELGNEIKKLDYDNARTFSEGLSVVMKNDKWGYVDINGNEVIPLKYDLTSPFDSGAAIVMKGSDYYIFKKPIQDNNIKVVLNNTVLEFQQSPVMRNDRVLVPMRKIFESMGASITWNGRTKTVTANRGSTTLQVQIDSKDIVINGKKVTLDSPAILLNGQTFVPLRAVTEPLDAEVAWVGPLKTVVIQQD